MAAKKKQKRMARPRMAWAIITATGKIDVETLRERKTDARDMLSIYDEETAATVQRVIVVDARDERLWQKKWNGKT
jgi:hypothetical protein